MKTLVLTLLAFNIINASACPKGSFLVKSVVAYQLDFREIWGQHYELSVSNTRKTTPKNFYGNIIIHDADILNYLSEIELPFFIKKMCVRSFEANKEEFLELIRI